MLLREQPTNQRGCKSTHVDCRLTDCSGDSIHVSQPRPFLCSLGEGFNGFAVTVLANGGATRFMIQGRARKLYFTPLLCVQPFRQTDSATREATLPYFLLKKGEGRGFPGRDDHENGYLEFCLAA